ncbi:MAG: hypothetical protein JST16_04310 [Bdellovibrionales bacterium]|nr:hypothetical protein [Bdellovibrionales bacterium]
MAQQEGNELYQLLISLTGLEESQVRGEIDPILQRLGLSAMTLTMDDVRRVMIVYLNEFSAQMDPEDAGELVAEMDMFGIDPNEQVEA